MRREYRRYATFGAAGLAIAALIVATVFGIQWWRAADSDSLRLAQVRDAVAKVGAAAAKAYTELDYTKPEAYFQRQLAISTPDMRTQIQNSEQAYRKAMAKARTTVATTIHDIGVEELNNNAGKATILAAASTSVTKAGQQPAAKPMRLEIQLTRIGSEWKVSGVGSAPIETGDGR